MVIDSSAILSILQNEPERRSFNEAIQSAEFRLLSAASLLEVSIVLEARFGADGQGDLDCFVTAAEIDVVSFDRDQAELARIMPWPNPSLPPCCTREKTSSTPILHRRYKRPAEGCSARHSTSQSQGSTSSNQQRTGHNRESRQHGAIGGVKGTPSRFAAATNSQSSALQRLETTS